MKQLLLALSLGLISSLGHADTLSKHQKTCETDEVKSLMGKKGSCRIVVAPKKVELEGLCTGTLEVLDNTNCMIAFVATKVGSAVNLTCGDPQKPIVNQDMRVEASGFNVMAIVTTKRHKKKVINDSNEYVSFSSDLLSLNLTDKNVNGFKTREASIHLILKKRVFRFKNVVCF